MWVVLYPPDPQNKEKKWDILLNPSRFPLGYVKHHIKSIQKVSKADKYMVQNLTYSGVYLGITFSYDLLQKVLKLVSLTTTRPEVCIATMSTVISDYYYSLVETLNHMKSLKLNDHPEDNVAYCCDAILVDADCLEISIAFKPEHLGYIICIFEDTSDFIYHLWETHKYK